MTDFVLQQSNDTTDALFNRGAFLRQLRELEQEDEKARISIKDVEYSDKIESSDMLQYSSFLAHQSYYDDYKHVNYKYLDFKQLNLNRVEMSQSSSLSSFVIEQDRTVGKGGFVWDAGFILGQHVLHNSCWQQISSFSRREQPSIIELGAGTGISGLMVAKTLPTVNMYLSDLPDLLPLMKKNIENNNMTNASAFVLEWGQVALSNQSNYDMILGADVVASIYSQSALLQTIAELAHERTIVFLTLKNRLGDAIGRFEKEMRKTFENVHLEKPDSDNKNPNVWVMVAQGKRSIQ